MGNTESQVVIMDNGSRRNSRRSSRLKKKTSTAQESDEIKTDTVDKDIDRVEFPEIEDLPAPPLTSNDRKLIVRSWTIVDQQISQVGLSSFLELFRRAPETLSVFPFLKQLGPEDMEFYHQLKNHSIRITGVISMLVKQLESEERPADEAIRDLLLDLGRRHFSYGAKTSHMELLGRVFAESLQPIFEGDPEAKAIQEAWLVFFSVIVFWLQKGFRFVQYKGNVNY